MNVKNRVAPLFPEGQYSLKQHKTLLMFWPAAQKAAQNRSLGGTPVLLDWSCKT